MLDRYASAWIKPCVDRLASHIVRMRITANQVTILAFCLGLIAALLIAARAYHLGLIAMLFSRLCDALDGAVARKTVTSDAGGYLDITLDFIFYASIPLAFALANPALNALPAAVLLAAFIGTASSFLSFAVLASKRGLVSINYPHKSFYYLGGLTEATETLIFFIAMCIWPNYFSYLAYLFAVLCCATIVTRIYGGWRSLM
jgi:phosphatidylglycerophosphate synthase